MTTEDEQNQELGWEQSPIETANGKSFVELHKQIFGPTIPEDDVFGIRPTESGL